MKFLVGFRFMALLLVLSGCSKLSTTDPPADAEVGRQDAGEGPEQPQPRPDGGSRGADDGGAGAGPAAPVMDDRDLPGDGGAAPTDVPADEDEGAGPDADGGVLSQGDAGSDAGEGGQNLLQNPGFERADCEGWRWNTAVVGSGPEPRAGQRTCRVCALGDASVYSLFQAIPVELLVPGVTYVGTAWVRTDVDPSVGPPTTLNMGLQLYGPSPGPVGGSEAPTQPLTATWQQVSKAFTYEPTAGGAELVFELINRASDRGCFLVDDAELKAMP